jgi:hypothetical protein
MRLADFERIDGGEFPRYLTRVEEARGGGTFELRIAGPAKVIDRMFGDADVELTIDSAQEDSAVKEHLESTHKEHRRAIWELASFDDVAQLLKPAPRRPDRETSVFASARPESGDGTPFFVRISSFFVPGGVNLFFMGSFVLFTSGFVRPASGDQDLFLHLFGPGGPVVSSSILPGTATDPVSFFLPVFPFVPVFRIFGFSPGVCSTFSAVGV